MTDSTGNRGSLFNLSTPLTTDDTNMSHISCLAPEVLQHIFLNLQLTDEISYTFISIHEDIYHLERKRCPPLFRILMVCQQWREVALDYSALWSKINYVGWAPLWDFMTTYSRSCPLTILGTTYITIPKKVAVLDRVLEVQARLVGIRLDLTFDAPDDDAVKVALDRMLHPQFSPQLRSFSAYVCRPESYYTPEEPITITISSPQVPPQLHTLVLSGLRISEPLQSPHQHLTTFEIHDPPSPWQSHQPDSFLDILAQFQKLQVLTIRYKTRVPRARPQPRSEPVALPCLQLLRFAGTPAHFAYMYPSMLIPISAIRELTLNEHSQYEASDVPEGWTAPPGQSDTKVTDNARKEHLDNVCVNLKQLVIQRLCDKDTQIASESEAYRVDCMWNHVETPNIEDTAVHVTVRTAPLPKIDPLSGSALSAKETTSSVVFSIAWNSEEYYQHDWNDFAGLFRNRALPFLSSILPIFPSDVVRHLHCGMDIAEFPMIGDEPCLPCVLEWRELHTLHLEGAGVAAWMAKLLARTRRIELDDEKWHRETTAASAFPNLKTLILDKIDKSSFPEPGDVNENIWSVCLHLDSARIVNAWYGVLRARMASGYKLERLGLVEGTKARLWRTWLMMASEVDWLKGCDIQWRRDKRWSYHPMEHEWSGDWVDYYEDYASEDEDMAEEGWIMGVYDL